MLGPSSTGELSAPARVNMAYVWAICLVAAMGGLMFGYDWIVINGAAPFFERSFNLATAAQQGWAMSSALVGCLLGAVLSGMLSDRLGRKWLLVVSAVVFAVSSVGTAAAGSLTSFVVWRILGGVAIGLASNLSPMYIAEVAPAAARGRLVAINQLTIVIGILVAQGVNYFIAEYGAARDRQTVTEHARQHGPALAETSIAQELAWQVPHKDRGGLLDEFTRLAAGRSQRLDCQGVQAIVHQMNASRTAHNLRAEPTAIELAGRGLTSWNVAAGWRWMFGVTAAPAVLFFVLMFLVPESPRWLAKNGKPLQAHRVLARIGGTAYADEALASIEETLVGEIETVRFRELLAPKMLRILIFGVALAVLQQWCGINVIFYYAAKIFESAGYSVSDALLNIVVIGAVNLAFTLVAIYSVDRFGRRILMIIGFAGLTLTHTLIGASYFTGNSGSYVLVLTLAAIGIYGLSLAPITWVVLSEIFPNRIRGAAMSVSVVSLWTACFVLTYTFPLLNEALGSAYTFWIYAAICAAGFVLVKLFLPETKGKTLEQIERELVD